MDVPRARLASHHLVPPYFATPADAVRALVAVQAQDYAAGLWAIGQRTEGCSRAEVEAAIAARQIVRTWPMRGTLHFVASEDIRWLLALLAPRVIARAASRYRQLGLDAKTFRKARALVEKHLAGTTLTRPALMDVFARAKIDPANQRGFHIVGELAMQRVICFAPHEGKQPAFALLDDWIPTSRTLDTDEALGEVARRYFASHGPATLADFTWWSGLTQKEARRAIEIAAPEAHGAHYGPTAVAKKGTTHLLSAWDEYTVAYRDRTAIVDGAVADATLNGLAWVYAIDGRIAGTWKRNPITLSPPSTKLAKAIARFSSFERPRP